MNARADFRIHMCTGVDLPVNLLLPGAPCGAAESGAGGAGRGASRATLANTDADDAGDAGRPIW